ncbi:ketoacyl-ACP synthase III [bacterium]|nr:ketoacyl-ACP synthase III [bacterium]
MAQATISGVRLAGITCAVPSAIEDTSTDIGLYGEEEALKFSETTGIKSRRIVDSQTCTSDLCQAAAEDLLDRLGWERDSVDALIFITQTPDYLLPATSCCLQSRLGLSTKCAAFDINLGCSGYVYGMWLASQMIGTGLKRVLLLVGDTPSRVCRPEDRSTRPLFGDAGTATAITADPSAGPSYFVMGTDGEGKNNLIVKHGLFRESDRFGTARGNTAEGPLLFMDGAEIFTFTLQEVPPLIKQTLKLANWSMDDVNAVVMHQANGFILNYLAKRMKLPAEKMPLSIGEFGNTSSATIPLTMAAAMNTALTTSTQKLVMVGFGVGYSWGSVAMECGPLPELKILTVEPSTNSLTQEQAA